MHTVFISYSTKNTDKAIVVRDFLEKNGVICWMAPRNLSGGTTYNKDIPLAIDNCSYFVLIASSQSAKSRWVQSEINRAFNNNKITFIPYDIENFSYPEDWFNLDIFQHISAFNNFDEALCELLKSVGGKHEIQKNEISKNEIKSQYSKGSYGVRPEFMQKMMSIVKTCYSDNHNKRTIDMMKEGVGKLKEIDPGELNQEEQDVRTYCLKIFSSSIRGEAEYKGDFNTEAYKILYTGNVSNFSDCSNYELYGDGTPVTPLSNFNLLDKLKQISDLGTIVPSEIVNPSVFCPKCGGDIVPLKAGLGDGEHIVLKCSNSACDCYVVATMPHKAKQSYKYFTISDECGRSQGLNACSGKNKLRHANFRDVMFQCDRCGSKKHPELIDYDSFDTKCSEEHPY
ncbi:MAG: toll/interleukin-1 receptor domain-containing protein [Paludibacteraceae bacterium]|nr:toll/interleukin-1 receptor domain-containing protein [Paludibacteraceae bacterium]